MLRTSERSLISVRSFPLVRNKPNCLLVSSSIVNEVLAIRILLVANLNKPVTSQRC